MPSSSSRGPGDHHQLAPPSSSLLSRVSSCDALSNLRGAALGHAFILAVCVIWVGGSFLVSSLEARGLSPLLITYVCNALFVWSAAGVLRDGAGGMEVRSIHWSPYDPVGVVNADP